MHRQLEWGFLPGGQQGRRRARQAAHTRGAGLCSGTPSLSPGLWSALPQCSGLGGRQCPTTLAAPTLSQLSNSCPVVSVGGQPESRNHPRYFNRENLTQGIGETGVGGLKRQKWDTWVTERSYQLEAVHPLGPRKRLGLLKGRRLAEEGPSELGARPRRRGRGWPGAGCVGRRQRLERRITGVTLTRQSKSHGGKGAWDPPAGGQSCEDKGAGKRCCRPYTATPPSPPKASLPFLPS